MPTLYEDFINPHFAHSLWASIINGFKVLLAVGVVAGILTYATGGTQPKKWPTKAEEH